MTAKVVKRKKGEVDWQEVEFPRASGGFRSKYKEPSLRATKYGISLYCCDGLEGEMQVAIFSNGSKIAIVADDNGPKKIKADKKGRRLSLPGKKMAAQLGLEIGAMLIGEKGKVSGKQGWIFEAK